MYLKELVEDGYYDPFRIDQPDVAELMKLKIVVSEEDAYTHNFTDEDEKRLADMLEDDWDNLDDYSRVVNHTIRDTSGTSRMEKTVSSITSRGHEMILSFYLDRF